MLDKNKNYEIIIDDLGHSGEGIGKIDGFTVLVEDGLPGDNLLIKINALKKNYAIGQIIKMLSPSKDRVKPKCDIAHLCGGCQIMHMDYQAQLKIKQKRVKDTLERIGKIQTLVHTTIGMKNPYEYRNKAQFPVGIMKGKAILGFYKKGTHDIVDTKYCHIQSAINQSISKAIKQYIDKYKISVYDEQTRKGLIRHILTRVSFVTGQVMVVIITNRDDLPYKKELIDLLVKEVKGLTSIVHNINSKNTNIILGEKTKTIYGEDKIVDYIGGLKFNISPHSFFQVNPIQMKILYEKTLEYANLTGEETVFDIYCGIGTISLFIAQNAKKVYGVEIVEQAIKDAKENAKINNIKNAEFYTGAAEEIIPQLYKQGIKADVIVLDPPRKGCEEIVLKTIVEMDPKRIVYVSCNPATLARDLAYLDENGYRTIEVQPVDMFPHTAHVECVALIECE